MPDNRIINRTGKKKRRGFAYQLLKSHLMVASIGLIMLVITLVATSYLRTKIFFLTEKRSPIAQTSFQMLAEVQHSLAGLRGWVSVGSEELLRDWKNAWKIGIEPAMADLIQHGKTLKDSTQGEIIARLPNVLAELKESQWWVVDVAQTPGNEPARVTYLFEVEPVADSLFSIIDSILVASDQGNGAGYEKENLNLLNAQQSFSIARLQLEKIISDGSIYLEDAFHHNLATTDAILKRFAEPRFEYSAELVHLFNLYQRESRAFEKLAQKAILERKSPKWNYAQHLMLTETVPLANIAIELASSLSSHSAELMRRDSVEAIRATNLALAIMVAVIVLMIASAFILSNARSRALTKPIDELSKAAHRFSTGMLDKDIPILSDDELGDLTRVFNSMRMSLLSFQDKLVRQERLAILGQLSGGVAHELRNPLGVISNAVYYLKMIQPEADEKVKEYLENITSEIDRAIKIVSDLLDLSRTRTADKQEIRIPDLITKVLDGYPPLEEIQVITSLDNSLSTVFIDPLQIEQVVINLITNACQAMPEGGILEIKAKIRDSDMLILFKDTGIGIPGENLDKLFEPLFTTKARGIGLGLSVAKNLAEINGGRIEVESEEGRSNTFSLILPLKETES